jgi:hypothetical protein
MGKGFLAILLAILALGGYQAYQHFGPPAEPYKAYKKHATAMATGSNMAARAAVGTRVPKITKLEYTLESQEAAGDGQVNLVAVQHLYFYWTGVAGPQRPTITETRHRVLLKQDNEGWKVAKLEKEKLK